MVCPFVWSHTRVTVGRFKREADEKYFHLLLKTPELNFVTGMWWPKKTATKKTAKKLPGIQLACGHFFGVLAFRHGCAETR
jgi:hypothetical protein